ncbi:MAG TPA: glycosyltransferase family 2 protein [Chitinophagaceae bacterium]|mgnify:CR=1 FL=1|nr:glycosyltransferase family 2 protein [Chitinophagaceae bacterium]
MKHPKCSLHISTYNWPDALRLCLQTVLWQKIMPDELVITDDGSGPETKKIIDEFTSRAPFLVKHAWHEDNGFRLYEIQNKAILKSDGDYIIQIDGDCLLHPLFIADHMRLSKPGTFVCGTRSMIDEEYTNKLLSSGNLPFPFKARKHLSKKYNAVYSQLLAVLHYWFQRSGRNYRYVLGCNIAFWKSDILKINGHNEDFFGWGKEDNEMALRLLNAKVGIRFAKFNAIQYHLYHKERDRSGLSIREEMLQKTKLNGVTYVCNGIYKT